MARESRELYFAYPCVIVSEDLLAILLPHQRCILPTRAALCVVLALVLCLPAASLSQSQTGKQVVAANPTSRDEKKGSLTSADVKPAETPKKSSVVRHLDRKQDGYKVAETMHFRILHDQAKPIVETVGEAAAAR